MVSETASVRPYPLDIAYMVYNSFSSNPKDNRRVSLFYQIDNHTQLRPATTA